MIGRESLSRDTEPKEGVESRVVIEFFRHAKKENDPEKLNKDLQLTLEGRQQAFGKGEKLAPQPEVALAGGSPKARTRDTALRVTLAGGDEITEDMSMEEIEGIVQSELGNNQRKVITIEGLDYEREDSPLPEEGFRAAKEGRYLDWVINESDEVSREKGDRGGYTSTKLAAGVAEVIQKYLKVGDTFAKIVEKDPQKYAEYGNQMERYFGTHQAVQESFLARYLEKAKGDKARQEFLEGLGPAGFDELQGIRIEMINEGGKQTARIQAELVDEKLDIEIDPAILKEIIEDAE